MGDPEPRFCIWAAGHLHKKHHFQVSPALCLEQSFPPEKAYLIQKYYLTIYLHTIDHGRPQASVKYQVSRVFHLMEN